ncbi:MAG: hypothetical protein JRH03_16020 [Deltaproteobacteria bacterium]|nr:hypothetical protein [Deltaproteobacteria bacterium]MBW2610869.1 hypothetical protein [Deltaproteobacteria bacterium]
MQAIEKFIGDWQEDELGLKPAFVSYFNDLKGMADADIEFNERPGISYSLRGMHKNSNGRPLFVMIDDDPKQRWLSVCFYGDTITDPDEEGDLIPEGLLGDDGYCFDLVDADESLMAYVRQRIQEAYLTL